MREKGGKGELFIVGSPIGNLADITLRALSTLKEVDFIISEDTRTTLKLLNHFKIQKPLFSFHEHSSSGSLEKLLFKLRDERAAYLTEAGTPGLSDPSNKLVAAALKEGFKVVPIPGVSALSTLVSVAGWPSQRFLFLGFLPKKGRQKIYQEIRAISYPVIFFESPFRLNRTLLELEKEFGETVYLVVGREMTKLFEEFVRGRVKEVKERFQNTRPRGELTIFLSHEPPPKKRED